MSELDYSDFFTLKIIKVKDDETGASHWEVEASDSKGEVTTFGTSPSFHGALDIGVETITEHEFGQWIEFDANNKLGDKND